MDKLIRKERGERLFQARFKGSAPALVFRYTSLGLRLSEKEVGVLESIRQALETVESVSVPRLLQWELVDDRVLEFCTEDPKGVTVADLGREKPLGLHQALALWEGLITALDPLHKRGLAYGLCHPDKLLVDRKGRMLLAEPGVVPVVSVMCKKELTYASSMFQRLFVEPEFVPPELLRGGQCTPASDVFQAAVLFFKLVSGSGPFGTGMSLEIYNRMLKGQMSTLLSVAPDAPLPLARLVADCLLPEPDGRPADAVAVRRKLASIRMERGSLAEPILRCPEARYSQRFSQILSVHDGGNGVTEDVEVVDEQRGDRSLVEKEALLGQLDQLRKSRSGPVSNRTGQFKTWIALGTVVLLAIVLSPYYLPDGSRTPQKYAGVKPLDGDGATHHEMVWDEKTSRLHPTVRSLLDSIPLQVKTELAKLGIDLEGDRSFIPPVLPPYRIQIRAASGDVVVLELSARNRLHSAVLPSTLMPEGIVRYSILYDAQGTPRLILALTAAGRVASSTPIVPFGP